MNTVIFDLGKVLLEYDWKHLMNRFKFDEKTYQKVAEAVFLSDTWQQGDAGVYDETTWLEAFIENAPDCEAEIRQVYRQLSGCVWKYPYTDELDHLLPLKGLSHLLSIKLFRISAKYIKGCSFLFRTI